MKTTAIIERLPRLGGAKWEVHMKARKMIAAGADIVEMTIGEPDVPTPSELADTTVAAIRAGRTGYSDGRGEINLRRAPAEFYRDTQDPIHYRALEETRQE